jgi:hypothetical protein
MGASGLRPDRAIRSNSSALRRALARLKPRRFFSGQRYSLALRRAALVLNPHASRADTGVGLPVFPLLSLARAKNGIHAVFHLRVCFATPRNLFTPASLPVRLRRHMASMPLLGCKFLLRKPREFIHTGIHAGPAAPAHGIHAVFHLRVCFANPGNLFRPASLPARFAPGSRENRENLADCYIFFVIP